MIKQFIIIIILSIIFTLIIRWIFRHCEDINRGRSANKNVCKEYRKSAKNAKHEKGNNILSYDWSLFSDFFFVFGLFLFIWPGKFFVYLYSNYLPHISILIELSLIWYALIDLWRSFCEFKKWIPSRRIYLSDLKNHKTWIYIIPIIIIFVLYLIAIFVWAL